MESGVTMSAEPTDTTPGLSLPAKIVVGAAIVVSLLWPFGPLVVGVLVAWLAMKDKPASARRRVFLTGLGVATAQVVLLTVLLVTGAFGDLVYSTH